MAYEPNPGQGFLFPNKDRTNDKQPNAKGYVIAHRDIREGERLDLAAWTKEDRNGNRYQSLKMQDVYKAAGSDAQGGQPQAGEGGGQAPSPTPPLDDEIPF